MSTSKVTSESFVTFNEQQMTNSALILFPKGYDNHVASSNLETGILVINTKKNDNHELYCNRFKYTILENIVVFLVFYFPLFIPLSGRLYILYF